MNPKRADSQLTSALDELDRDGAVIDSGAEETHSPPVRYPSNSEQLSLVARLSLDPYRGLGAVRFVYVT